MKTYKTEIRGGLLFVRAAFTGPEGTKVLKLLLDTGSTFTILPWEILESAGYDPGGIKQRQRIVTGSGYEFAPVVSVKEFHCLGKSIENYVVLAHDLPAGAFVDGLLGMNFLRKFCYKINPKEGSIELYD